MLVKMRMKLLIDPTVVDSGFVHRKMRAIKIPCLFSPNFSASSLMSYLVSKIFFAVPVTSKYPSHRIFGHMHRTLNVIEKNN